MKNSLIIIFFLFGFKILFAQEGLFIKDDLSVDGKNFKLINEFYIYGDAKVIGNSILSEHKSNNFNGTKTDNDDIDMKYIDVDDNDETFSSSKATLQLPNNFKKISYAGLYWSATYSLEEGKRKKSRRGDKFKGDNRANKAINTIKFKTPNSAYFDVTGDVIYDGASNNIYEANSPYVCYANITELLRKTEVLNGEFMVANINASRGYISGGSAGGWMLYVIYQAPTDNPKYITTYNGFASVNKDLVDISFENFKSIDQGEVKTSLVLSALEGDSNLQFDECAIIKRDSTYYNLKNENREPFNFFNSTISSDLERFPNSKNTLGFDIATLEIPNENNAIIDNNTTETTLRFKTKADEFYLYFTAFKTEIKQTLFELAFYDQENEIILETEETETVNNVENQRRIKNNSNWSKPIKKGFDSKEFEVLVNKKSIIITDIKSGYYVITNVFNEEKSAQKWEAYLVKKGLNPQTFINPNNNWIYVYILQTESAKEAFSLQQDLKQEKPFKDTWVLKINLD